MSKDKTIEITGNLWLARGDAASFFYLRDDIGGETMINIEELSPLIKALKDLKQMDNKQERYAKIEAKGEELARLLDEFAALITQVTSASREQDLALSNCKMTGETIVLWANAAIARHE
jgi:hypothetical protein